MNTIPEAILGGILIGVAASILLWGLGRVAGISGIFWNAIAVRFGDASEQLWRLFFLVGLVLGPLLLMLAGYHAAPQVPAGSSGVMILAGLLVGFGTRLGSGCTSGHGICGMARLSSRSIVATLLFMSVGLLTVSLMRHVF